MVVLPMMMQPASRMRATGGASAALGVMSLAAVPIGIGTPRTAILSFTVIGTPSSALFGVPARQRRSAAAASSSAPAASSEYMALILPSQAVMRARQARTASSGDSAPLEKAAASVSADM